MATSSPDPEISFDNVDLIQDNDHTANSQENDNLIDMSSIQHERDHRSNSEALSSNVRSRTGLSMPASEIINAHSTPQHTDDRRHVHLKSDRNVYDQCTNNANEYAVHTDNSYSNRGDFAPRSTPMMHAQKFSIKPDTYDGSLSFEVYASHFEDCAELSRWDNRTKVLMLASNLRGIARNYYMSLTEHERRDYHTLSSRLSERFGTNGNHQYSWLNKFESRHRQKGESISSLADDLRQLAQKAYTDFDHQSQERLALNQLYKLISIEMKCRCIDHNCTTTNEAVTVIERYESIVGTHLPHIRAVDVDNGIETTLKQIATRLDKLENNSSHTQTNTQRLCFGCNMPDHLWATCPQNRKARNRSQYTANPRRVQANYPQRQHSNDTNMYRSQHSNDVSRRTYNNQEN